MRFLLFGSMGKMRTLKTSRPAYSSSAGSLQLADDVLVNPPRLVRGEQLGFDLLAVDLHGELVDVRALGDGEHERALQPRGVGVVELLIHGGHGHLVGDMRCGP